MPLSNSRIILEKLINKYKGYTEGSSYQGHFTKDYIVFGNEIEDYYFKNGYSKNKGFENSRFGGFLHNNQSIQSENRNQEELVIQNIIDRRKLHMPFGCTVK